MEFFQICSKFGKNSIYLLKKRVQGEQFICALRNRREREIQGERGVAAWENVRLTRAAARASGAVRLKLPSSQTPGPSSKDDIFDCARGAIHPSSVCIPLSASKRLVRFAAPSARVNAPLRESERAGARARSQPRQPIIIPPDSC